MVFLTYFDRFYSTLQKYVYTVSKTNNVCLEDIANLVIYTVYSWRNIILREAKHFL